MIDRGSLSKRFIEYVSACDILDEALSRATLLNLNNWCIVGGAIRDSIWSMLEGKHDASSIKDIDLIYFDATDTSKEQDLEIEAALRKISTVPWSVKNQARMHVKSNDAPYRDIREALSCSPDTISSIYVTRSANSRFMIGCCFGYEDIMSHVFRPTPHFMINHSFGDYVSRVQCKGWLERWPRAQVVPW